jgi:hypothetical protein
MHHIHSYFLIKFNSFKSIILYPSRNKTRVLGAALSTISKQNKLVKTTKYNRKVWSVKTITNLLENRNDQQSLQFLQSERKKDDLCDTVSQLLSYVITETLKFLKIKTKHTTLKTIKKEFKKSNSQILLQS